jgi:histidyl-tRNA synthetase
MSEARIKARLPRGFVDRTADELRHLDTVLRAIRQTYELYGFEALETPAIEYADALGKFLPDDDRPNEGVFSFADDDEQWLSLRYDLTAPLARFVAENFERLPKPYRSYRNGYVYRNEKPGPGRFRQFMQFDADIVGAPNVHADAEICAMMADTLETLGIKRGDYIVRVNNRKVLDGIMETIGLAGVDYAKQRLGVLRAIDKLDKFGVEGVKLLLGEGRKDESGDFTKGAGLSDGQAGNILDFLAKNENSETIQGSDAFAQNATFAAGIEELQSIEQDLRAQGYGPDRIRIDVSVVRGLEYYTGPVYEAELTFPVKNEKGDIVRFGSVAGGGRYDGLVGNFLKQDVPATGFSIGVSRLMAALASVGKLDESHRLGPVVVLVMDRDRVSDYQAMVAKLRAAGIRSEVYLGGSGMKAQMKYADRRNAPCVVIQGSNEKEQGKIQIKDLIKGKQLSESIEDNKTWREERPAQFEANEADLVNEVQKLIAAYENEGAQA